MTGSRSEHSWLRSRAGVAILVGLFSLVMTDAMAAKKNCHCVMATSGWKTGVVKDLGRIKSYDLFAPSAGEDCSKLCAQKTSGQAGFSQFRTASEACALLKWQSACVRSYAYVGGVGTDAAVATTGTFSCTAPRAAVSQLTCPKGWTANLTNEPGGGSTDGKCKKIATQPISGIALPPNGTEIGTWGFTWGNAIYVWGTKENGGAPSNVVVTPAEAGMAEYSEGC
jgi:hypothetical protein